MDTNQHNERVQASRRFKLALFIIIPSLLILITISLVMLFTTKVAADTIFTALIGLIGTWVGTILAFYYSKDNFDAASKSTQDLIDRVTSADKLNSLKAENEMLKLADIQYLKVEEGSTYGDFKMEDLITNYFERRNRLPVLDSNNHPSLLIHRSVVDKYLSEVARAGKPVKDLTLGDLMSSKYSGQLSKGFATVKPDDSLTVVKSLMENLSTDEVICSDVLITSKGSKASPVVGWITNTIVVEKSKI